MTSQSKLIRDINGKIWKFSPEKKIVYCEEGDSISTRDDGGYKAKSYEDAVEILDSFGLISVKK